jgi:nitroreductase
VSEPSDDERRKRVDTRFDVIDLLAQRWSPRSFTNEMPTANELGSLFEAARLAPSAHNTQPPRFVVARRGHPGYDELLDCLSTANQLWARTAPVLVLAVAMHYRYSPVEGAMVPYPHAIHDLGLAVMSLIVQAEAEGLSCHPMAGFDPDLARERFDVPPMFEPVVVVAVGHRGSAEQLPPQLVRREYGPRSRRPLEELVFEKSWDRVAPWLIEPTK